jgi:hypothetical protein
MGQTVSSHKNAVLIDLINAEKSSLILSAFRIPKYCGT